METTICKFGTNRIEMKKISQKYEKNILQSPQNLQTT